MRSPPRAQRSADTSPPSDADLIAWYASGELLARASGYFGLSGLGPFRAVAHQAAALAASGQLDLLALVESGAVASLPSTDFFTVQQFLVEALPALDVPLPRMLAAVEALVTQGGADMAATRPNAALRTWLQTDRSRAEALITLVAAGDSAAAAHLTFALEALLDPGRARDFLTSVDPMIRASAITALSRMADPDPSSRAVSLDALAAAVGDGGDDMVCANVVNAALAIASQGDPPSPEALMRALPLALKARGDGTLNRAADGLWSYSAAREAGPLAALLEALSDLNPEHLGIINQLDLGLKTLIDAGHRPEALDFLAALLIKYRGRLKALAFNSTWEAVVNGPPEPIGRWIVAWLLSGQSALGAAVSDILSHLERDETGLTLDRSVLPLSAIELGYLARKAVGWFMLQPHLATAVLVAILGVCDTATAREVAGLLAEPVLRNYPAMRDRLETVPVDDPAKAWIDAALRENAGYLDALKALPEIPELRPSEHHRRIHQLHQNDEMRAAHKAAEANSVLLSLVHRSTLLYGVRSLTYVEDFGGGPRRPMEMELGTHEVSMMMPRLEMLDPLGLQHMLVRFRGEVKPQ